MAVVLSFGETEFEIACLQWLNSLAGNASLRFFFAEDDIDSIIHFAHSDANLIGRYFGDKRKNHLATE